MTKCSEVGNDGFDQWPTMDCFDMEKHPSVVGSLKKTRGISVKRWVNHFLGFFHSEMGWFLLARWMVS